MYSSMYIVTWPDKCDKQNVIGQTVMKMSYRHNVTRNIEIRSVQTPSFFNADLTRNALFSVGQAQKQLFSL